MGGWHSEQLNGTPSKLFPNVAQPEPPSTGSRMLGLFRIFPCISSCNRYLSLCVKSSRYCSFLVCAVNSTSCLFILLSTSWLFYLFFLEILKILRYDHISNASNFFIHWLFSVHVSTHHTTRPRKQHLSSRNVRLQLRFLLHSSWFILLEALSLLIFLILVCINSIR